MWNAVQRYSHLNRSEANSAPNCTMENRRCILQGLKFKSGQTQKGIMTQQVFSSKAEKKGKKVLADKREREKEKITSRNTIFQFACLLVSLLQSPHRMRH